MSVPVSALDLPFPLRPLQPQLEGAVGAVPHRGAFAGDQALAATGT